MKYVLLLLIVLMSLTACQQRTASRVWTRVVPQTLAEPERYSGEIDALTIVNVLAPTDGVMVACPIQLGQVVQAGQVLVTLSSVKFAQAYREHVLAYLKAKNDYDNQVKKFHSNELLAQNGLIARNEYEAQQNELTNSYAVLLQQQSDLQPYAIPFDPTLLHNRQRLQAFFHQKTDQVAVYAPVSGVVLSPLKNTTSAGPMLLPPVGSSVKEGDSLLRLADLRAYRVIIHVSQMDINHFHLQQSVRITGEAFPETLSGMISQISSQAITEANTGFGGSPTFLVEIQIPHVPSNSSIRLGMSAKVELADNRPATLTIPLTAVGIKDGQSVVIRRHGQQQHTVVITTGKTSLDRVEVLAGLTEGDQILATYPT